MLTQEYGTGKVILVFLLVQMEDGGWHLFETKGLTKPFLVRRGLASNIKSRVNRLSVLAAITSTQQRLKLYNRVPTNGLIVYCGTILTDEGKEKKVNFDFEPFKPMYVTILDF